MIDRWITDDEPSVRFPLYTRANADEVGPEPFSPLGWTLGWQLGCIPGVADGFVSFGIVRATELRPGLPEVFGNWGGYFYNQLSITRLMGVRMPGASPEAMDLAYFGDHPGVPPYVAHPEDDDPELSAKLGETMAWVMGTADHPRMREEAVASRAVRASRPEMASLSDAGLIAYARSMGPRIRAAWGPYCEVCLGASLGPGAIQVICAGVGRPGDAIALMSAIGGVESAQASLAIWDLGRIVASSPQLTALFDGAPDGLLDRLRAISTTDATRFAFHFDALISEFGHRGPNEWDMLPDSWETRPVLALGMIERIRHQRDERSPRLAAERATLVRERLAEELLELVSNDPVTHQALQAALSSAASFLALRELGKSTCIRLINEAKVALFELGRRGELRGQLDAARQIFMLREQELNGFLDDPHGWRVELCEREHTFGLLKNLEPPYIVNGNDGVPSISKWPPRGATGRSRAVAVGDVLQGGPGAPGIAEGRARIVDDPADPGDLQPDDIMIVHTTDPSWAPLFLSVGGVVCDVGAVVSHASIVSREVGVPCAVSVVNATSSIPDGARVRIDGTTGTVTVLELYEAR